MIITIINNFWNLLFKNVNLYILFLLIELLALFILIFSKLYINDNKSISNKYQLIFINVNKNEVMSLIWEESNVILKIKDDSIIAQLGQDISEKL